MKILSRDSLELGGFAGITEHRLVTDSRVFAGRKKPETFEGLGSMVYLADARYLPKGQSGMHPHSEIDVISIVLEGRVSHEGSLEHGKDLSAGDVQVQRAGGEGFSHNEINPDDKPNRMLQVWALPEVAGQPAQYKSYTPKSNGVTRIYGGSDSQTETFASATTMDIAHLDVTQNLFLEKTALVYVISGQAQVEQQGQLTQVKEGDLIEAGNLAITATEQLHLLIVSH
ncbi:pirin family protein [Pseudoalteromonas luteoviolacea]|uniref:pirin family protein n=1 Tax=Pseudoalteromonas luteoviolacea TaxID=43657 RepID=UPI001B3A4D20|nr:pirin family protein [Pseudoalteromonas luteoviolacea]MBQ4877973.1 pirin family protein [Pseudoalteromonas luteoviolacea]MBQ4907008.1 pirin family protein [Pseudoalteromonas luteoviolacea]